MLEKLPTMLTHIQLVIRCCIILDICCLMQFASLTIAVIRGRGPDECIYRKK